MLSSARTIVAFSLGHEDGCALCAAFDGWWEMRVACGGGCRMRWYRTSNLRVSVKSAPGRVELPTDIVRLCFWLESLDPSSKSQDMPEDYLNKTWLYPTRCLSSLIVSTSSPACLNISLTAFVYTSLIQGANITLPYQIQHHKCPPPTQQTPS